MTHTNAQGAFRLSFEYFPPKNDIGAERLWQSVTEHAPFAPEFVSVTYGAGGSTQDRTIKILERLKTQTSLDVAGHLTCADASREAVLATAEAYRALGVKRIVALRGDGKDGQFTPHPEGFSGSLELVRTLKDRDFDITIGAYPEPHPDSRGETSDFDYLKAKFDAGADRAITQFFFEKDVFLRWRDKAVKAGINKPLIPGILPVENFNKMKNFASAVNATVPHWLEAAFHNAEDAEAAHILAVAQACELITNLQSEGIDHFHLYTLNNPQLCSDICKALGCTAQDSETLSVA